METKTFISDDVYMMSEQEVITELNKYDIRIVYKPVALINEGDIIKEEDIYETLRKIKIRNESHN